jgi:hypothetical protein
MRGLVEVEADNLDEAIDKAIDKAAADETPLPYIDASFEVDEEEIELYNTLLEE